MEATNSNPLAEALAEAHKELKNPAKDRENPYFGSKYATLDALQDASRSILAKHGLTVTQVCQPHGSTVLDVSKVPTEVTDKDGVVTKGEGFKIHPFLWELRTVLLHTSGVQIESRMPLVAITKGPQQFGSELTYMRRYAYAAILNMTADEDDDANVAQELKPEDKKASPKKKEARKDDLLDAPKVDDPWKVKRPKGAGPVDTDTKPDEIPGLEPLELQKQVEEVMADVINPPEELTLLEQVRVRLKADKRTEEELMALIRSFKLTRAVMLDNVENKTLETILGKWETVQKRLAGEVR